MRSKFTQNVQLLFGQIEFAHFSVGLAQVFVSFGQVRVKFNGFIGNTVG